MSRLRADHTQRYYISFFHLLRTEPSWAIFTKAHYPPRAPSKSFTDRRYSDHRYSNEGFPKLTAMGKVCIYNLFLDAFQLHNTNMRRNTPGNNLFSSPTERIILSINVCNHSHSTGAKINGFFSSYITVFNSMCTQIYA